MEKNYKPEIYIFPEDKEAFIRSAAKMSQSICLDQLDCATSFARQPTEKTFDEILQICLDGYYSHYTMIRRDHNYFNDNSYFEVCASSMGINEPDYFIWINLSIDDGYKLIEKFNLKRR